MNTAPRETILPNFDLNQGALAPVADEVDIEDIRVEGKIPEGLNGVLVRNGPNPLNGRFEGNDVLSWWPEAAMFHGIRFQEGAVSYRNRWARTQQWGSFHNKDNVEFLVDTNPNVNFLSHAGEILALSEGGPPLSITSELSTLGASRRHPGLLGGVTAHPKIDPVTGDLMSFRSHWSEPWLRYGVSAADGSQTLDTEINVPAPSMMHDMAITANYSILLDLNVAYDFSLMSHGYRMPLRWHDNRQARLGVIPRMGGEIRWFEIESCFIQHVVNAQDDSLGRVVLEVVRYPWYLRLAPGNQGFQENPLGVLWRYVLDLKNGTTHEQQVDDRAIELPRINEECTGSEYRYLYAVAQPTSSEMRGVVRYDLTDGVTQCHEIAPGDQNSEPVFVPRSSAKAEDDGWILVSVYRRATDCNDVLVLDASKISDAPLATITLPRRIPAGFHGAWLPID